MNKRILVIGPAWVGDMVMAQALFIQLQQKAACEIDVIAPAWSLPLLAKMPEVRQGIVLPLGHGQFGWSVRKALGRSLQGQYDQAIVLPGSWKSALLPFFAGIPQRTGFRGEMRYGLLNDIRPLDKTRLRTTVQRFVALAEGGKEDSAETIPQPRFHTDTLAANALAARLGLPLDRPLIALMPGAEYGSAKQWPHFGELAQGLERQGARAVVFGSAKEQGLGEAIVAGTNAINLCGRTQLAEVVDLLALMRAAVSNDSGLMHVAAASGVPVVAIYGSSTPDFTPPLTAQAVIHYLRLPCSPCFKRTCPLGHTRCLQEIAPVQVLQSLQTL
jgi:heptosyltransferase-2